MKLAEQLDAPVCVGYQHNDAFPGNHPLFAGPLGYNGSKAAMQLIKEADVVLCLGTRLNPFSTLPGYGLEYWPSEAKIIQVDINPDRIGLTKKVSIGIVGDAGKVATDIFSQLSETAGDINRETRKVNIAETKSKWAQQLSSMDHEDDDPGTTWNQRARADKPDWMSPRMAWRASKQLSQEMRLYHLTSGIIVPLEMPILVSKKEGNIWRLVYLGHVVMDFHLLWEQK